jgi:hypothetical protein
MTYKKSPKSPEHFYCEFCNYKCCKQSEYNKHLNTSKHSNTYKYLQNDLQKNLQKIYTCVCGKEYKHRQSMYNHKKKCVFIKEFIKENNDESIDTPPSNELKMLTNLILEVVKSNTEIVKSNNQLQKQVLEISKDKTNTFINNMNSHNKTFNLNVFLNETCKDAMNITDFVESVKIKLIDLENVGTLGYVDGITNIIVKKLKELDISKRPVHCSDLKREILYIKDQDKWEKENNEKERLRLAIQHVAHKNIKMIPEWKKENPNYSLDEGKTNDKYLKIVMQSMGGSDKQEDLTFQDKIIRLRKCWKIRLH